MAPESEELPQHYSSLGMKCPAHRDDPLHTVEAWLEDKRAADGAEGLWRIHDDLYDLSTWVENHPGGPDWLQWTKGTDITEAFETYHISTLAEKLLPTFHVRKAKTVRNSPFTFKEDGFYRVTKKRVREVLKNVPDFPAKRSKIIADSLMFGYVACALLAVILRSFLIGAISGLFLGLVTIAAHNFFHQKDNFRMFYFDFSLMSSREWRISHAMSHHLFTNTVNDLEISELEPFLLYLPEDKHIFRRIISLVISPGFYTVLFISNYIKRFVSAVMGNPTQIGKADMLPFLIPMAMYFIGGKTILETLVMWFWIISVGSFHFGLVGLNAGHHHPNIFHDGDAPRLDRDWGLFQLDAVMDRHEITGSHFLVITNFGDHALHHMFPTVDHGNLTYLYPALKQTCSEFGVKFRVTSQLILIAGQFLQLFRVKPNPNSPDSKRKSAKKPWTMQQLLKPYRNSSSFGNMVKDE